MVALCAPVRFVPGKKQHFSKNRSGVHANILDSEAAFSTWRFRRFIADTTNSLFARAPACLLFLHAPTVLLLHSAATRRGPSRGMIVGLGRCVSFSLVVVALWSSSVRELVCRSESL